MSTYLQQLTLSEDEYNALLRVSAMRGHPIHELLHIGITLLLEQVEREDERVRGRR